MPKRAGGPLLLGLSLNKRSKQSLSQQLYNNLRDQILSGVLSPGQRIPSSRTLAKDLQISRTITVNALERLSAEGLLDARTGSGTFVTIHASFSDSGVEHDHSSPEDALSPKVRLSQSFKEVSKLALQQRLPSRAGAFTTGLPAADAFPVDVWRRRLFRQYTNRKEILMGYPNPLGYGPLREAICQHMKINRGVDCHHDDVFVVGGAQEGFRLVFSILLDRGDTVWLENPGTIGARNSLIASGANIIPVAVDRQGLNVEAGLQKAKNFKMVFVTPAHQQPMGVSMSLERRLSLIDAAEQTNGIILEDDYDGEFRYDGHPLPALKSIDQAQRVIYAGSFSKTLMPALRIGFLIVPPFLRDTFSRAIRVYTQGVPPNTQQFLAEALTDGFFSAHIRRMKKIYSERRAILYQSARSELQEMMKVELPPSGLHTVGHIICNVKEQDIATQAAKRGISVTPIERFSLAPTPYRGLVLGFSSARPSELKDGVKVLAAEFDRLRRKRIT